MPSVDAKPHDEGSAVTTNRDALDAQREHWQATFQANPDMYGTNPSQPGAYAAELFTQHHLHEMLELGAGQGRDTLAFLRAGLRVTALDYAPDALASLRQAATAAGLADRLITLVHDVRQPIPLPDASVDAVYSHMLFNMALSTAQLLTLAAEVRRVLRPVACTSTPSATPVMPTTASAPTTATACSKTAGSSSTSSTDHSWTGSPSDTPCST